jgi:hypothetical protein
VYFVADELEEGDEEEELDGDDIVVYTRRK